MFCEFTKIATEQNKQIQQFLISTKQKRTLFKNDLTANNVKYFFLEECKKNNINTTENKAVEKVDYCQFSNKQIKLKMYAEKVDCTNLSNMEINRKRYADKVDYSKQAIEAYALSDYAKLSLQNCIKHDPKTWADKSTVDVAAYALKRTSAIKQLFLATNNRIIFNIINN